jgi:hypothetical protein
VKLEFFQLFLDTPDKGFFNVFSEYVYKSKAPPAGDKTLRGWGFSLPFNHHFLLKGDAKCEFD